MTLKIAVLGSGPTGFAAAKAIYDYSEKESIDLDFHLFEYGNQDSTLNNAKKLGSLFKTAKPNSSQLFQQKAPDIFRIKSNLKNHLYGASNFGGWSKVWGSTFIPYAREDLRSLNLSDREIGDAVQSLTSRMHITNISNMPPIFPVIDSAHTCNRFLPKYEWKDLDKESKKDSSTYYAIPSMLGINDFNSDIDLGCNECGLCNFGCPRNHIWSSKTGWTDLMSRMNIKTHFNSYIDSLESHEDESVKINYVNQANLLSSEIFDKVFIALGPIQSPILLLRSRIATTTIKVFESRMIIMPFLLRAKFRAYEQMRISLSDYFLIRKGGDSMSLFSQVYFPSLSLIKLLRKQILVLRLIPEKIMHIFFKKIGFALIFFPANSYEFISIYLDKNNFINIFSKMKSSLLDSRRKQSAIFLRKFNLLPLRIFSLFPRAGQSFHLGGSLSDTYVESQTYVSNTCELHRIKNAYVVDSSIMQKIGPWPITFTAMIKSYSIVMNSLTES